MPRRRVAKKRQIAVDLRFHSEVIAKFISCIMQDGKRTLASNIVYNALEEASNRFQDRLLKSPESVVEEDMTEIQTLKDKQDSKDLVAMFVFKKALSNIQPMVEVRPRRVGGSTLLVPSEVPFYRSLALAFRSLKIAVRSRTEKPSRGDKNRNIKTVALRLAGEIMDAYDNKGIAVKRCQDTHRAAKANQMNAHFRFTRKQT